MFFADQVRLHHLRHSGVAAGSAVESRMRHNQRLGGHLQCAEHGLRAGVSEVHQDPQAIALLHNFRPKGRQTAKVSGRRDYVAQRRHHVVVLMKQLKIPHTPSVHFLHSFQLALDELCPFGRLDNSLLTTVMCLLKVFHRHSAVDMPLFQLRVHRREPVKVVVSRIARLLTWREIQHKACADGRKP
jgi:hypothetical protein